MRVVRAATGNFGDHEFCSDGVWELRINVGAGYRVYYALEDDQIILLLCAGDKSNSIVVDKTGLTGKYDISLKWTKEDPPGETQDAPSLFVALEEQMGLKLESTKGPVDVIVIEHAAMPSVD